MRVSQVGGADCALSSIYLQWTTWSCAERMVTVPVGSMKTSTVSGVTLSDGGQPSIMPPE